LAGYVGDADGHAAVAEGDGVEVVAADAARRLPHAADAEAVELREVRGEEDLLHGPRLRVVGLLRAVARTVDAEGDLLCGCGEELQIVRPELLIGKPLAECHE